LLKWFFKTKNYNCYKICKYEEVASVLCEWLGMVGIFWAQRCTVFTFTWCSRVKMSTSLQTKLFMSGSGSINEDKLR